MLTSFFNTTTNLWSDAFLAGRGGDLDNNDDGNNDHKDDDNDTVNEDNDEDPNSEDNGEDNDDLIFDTTTNLWSDAFMAGRGGDFDNDDNGNNNGRERG